MKIIVTDPIARQGIEILKASGLEVEEKPGIPPDELVKIIPDYDAIIVRSATKVTKPVIGAGNKLKVIGRAGVGLDNIDLKAAKDKGIKVLNTPAATSISVAELALGFMFAAARHIADATASMRQGKWEKKKLKGTELFGKTLGIIGSGRIGTELAKRADAMGMNVLIVDPYIKKCAVGEIRTLEQMLPKADYISIHVPLGDETYHMVNKAIFNKMKDGVIFVNASRGGIVDEDALYEACKSGKIGVAAIDVYEKEPLKDSPLYTLPNVIGTPHLGAQTKEGQIRAGIGVAEKVRDALLEKN
ncbi:3-phosphoglycerate dehydrogenase [candidate division WOR-3 bacterium JGI_Cruoil_03_51_56]|uniref:3-phosphoglycerate dehydrogenase n=1 Tax=candidate division WOR-3 bacterium JGI_Cruoil_03_51_56 TaxID=1973747 RepID=A0A235BSY1_UNCW3|nr:MAG: 3-phosphoglycerate dehydrogenase [candidate division WOR-3 bacterium JGI_Cruoil_03_51_56]